uniref:Uncharacterized protein n=1 Tax=Anguilla anguilla TaxID=7936 RepID=A0A0E9RMF1_ANGAN
MCYGQFSRINMKKNALVFLVWSLHVPQK